MGVVGRVGGVRESVGRWLLLFLEWLEAPTAAAATNALEWRLDIHPEPRVGETLGVVEDDDDDDEVLAALLFDVGYDATGDPFRLATGFVCSVGGITGAGGMMV